MSTNPASHVPNTPWLIDLPIYSPTATAAYATRAAGRAGEDAEIHKAAAGLCATDAAQTAVAVGRPATILASINQLPSSTFLIPIAAATTAPAASPAVVVGSAGAAVGNHVTVTAVDESSSLVVTTAALVSFFFLCLGWWGWVFNFICNFEEIYI